VESHRAICRRHGTVRVNAKFGTIFASGNLGSVNGTGGIAKENENPLGTREIRRLQRTIGTGEHYRFRSKVTGTAFFYFSVGFL